MPRDFLLIKQVIGLLSDRHPQDCLPYQVHDVADAIQRVSGVDAIEFVEFDDPDSPIAGQYCRFERSPGPYAAPESTVQVRYNGHMNYCWQRFVICKELCHALFDDDESRTETPEDIKRLAKTLVMEPKSKDALMGFAPFQSEYKALIAALEILCPLESRVRVLSNVDKLGLSNMNIAQEYKIPVEYVPVAFNDKYNEVMRALFREAG